MFIRVANTPLFNEQNTKVFWDAFRGYKMQTMVGNGVVLTCVALMMILGRHFSKNEVFH